MACLILYISQRQYFFPVPCGHSRPTSLGISSSIKDIGLRMPTGTVETADGAISRSANPPCRPCLICRSKIALGSLRVDASRSRRALGPQLYLKRSRVGSQLPARWPLARSQAGRGLSANPDPARVRLMEKAWSGNKWTTVGRSRAPAASPMNRLEEILADAPSSIMRSPRRLVHNLRHASFRPLAAITMATAKARLSLSAIGRLDAEPETTGRIAAALS